MEMTEKRYFRWAKKVILLLGIILLVNARAVSGETQTRVDPNPQTSYASGDRHGAMRMEDGTVKTLGSNEYLQRDVSDWTDIAAVAAGEHFTAGLRYDGTIVVAGEVQKQEDVERWTDITAIAGRGNTLIGLTADGSLRTNWYLEQYDQVYSCSQTGRIRAVTIMSQPEAPFVLMEDGRIIGWYGEYLEIDAGWTDVKYITSNGGIIFGLTEQGTVRMQMVYQSYSEAIQELDEFTDIVQLYVSQMHCFGVRSDGTIVVRNMTPSLAQPDFVSRVKEADNVAGITGAGYNGHSVAIVKKDGEIVPVIENYGNCDLSEMKNLNRIFYVRSEVFDEFAVIGVADDDQVYLYGTDGSMNSMSQYPYAVEYGEGIGFESIICVHSSGAVCEELLYLDKNGALWGMDDNHIYYAMEDGIRQFSCSHGLVTSYIVELKTDGTVRVRYLYGEAQGGAGAENWTGIRQVVTYCSRARDYGILGLREDGTIACETADGLVDAEVENWDNIVALYPGYYAIGALRSDGTAVFIKDQEGYDFGQYNTSSWKGLKQLALGTFHTVGLKGDGTVCATGRNDVGQCDVENWTDVVYVAAGENGTLGIQSDGSLLIAGEIGW